MGKAGDRRAVVDSQGKVFGVEGLRIFKIKHPSSRFFYRVIHKRLFVSHSLF